MLDELLPILRNDSVRISKESLKEYVEHNKGDQLLLDYLNEHGGREYVKEIINGLANEIVLKIKADNAS